MADRRKLEERIKKKEQEIEMLEEQLKEARVYIHALHDVLKMFPRDPYTSGDAETALRPGSLAAQARDVILKRGCPLHVSEIVKGLGKEPNRANKTAVGGSISAYVRKGEIFTRPGPNTFGLIELRQKGSPASDPPADFGVDRAAKPGEDDTPF